MWTSFVGFCFPHLLYNGSKLCEHLGHTHHFQQPFYGLSQKRNLVHSVYELEVQNHLKVNIKKGSSIWFQPSLLHSNNFSYSIKILYLVGESLTPRLNWALIIIFPFLFLPTWLPRDSIHIMVSFRRSAHIQSTMYKTKQLGLFNIDLWNGGWMFS